jgi:hypothetical protein
MIRPLRTVLLLVLLGLAPCLPGDADAQQVGHWYRCSGRIHRQTRLLKCCANDHDSAFYTAAAYCDFGEIPSCQITNDICEVSMSGQNCWALKGKPVVPPGH